MEKSSKASSKKIWLKEKEFFIAGMDAGSTEYGLKMFWPNNFDGINDNIFILYINGQINIFVMHK